MIILIKKMFYASWVGEGLDWKWLVIDIGSHLCVAHDDTFSASSCAISIISRVKCPQIRPVWLWKPFQLNEV